MPELVVNGRRYAVDGPVLRTLAIVSASALVAETPAPTREAIRHDMAGNLCRCGTYPKIEEAISSWRD